METSACLQAERKKLIKQERDKMLKKIIIRTPYMFI